MTTVSQQAGDNTVKSSVTNSVQPPSALEIRRRLGSPSMQSNSTLPSNLTTLSSSYQSDMSSTSREDANEIQRRLSTVSNPTSDKVGPGRRRTQGPSSSSGFSSAEEDDGGFAPPSPSRAVGSGSTAGQLPLSAISEAVDDGQASGTDSDASSIDVATGAIRKPRANIMNHLRASRESTRLSDCVAAKSGYLMKKGERRKAWKRRWFVLRGGQLAMYKNEKEYRLLRLIPLTEIHTCSPVELKKHAHAFGIVTPRRTYYIQAVSDKEVRDWCFAVERAKEEVKAAATVTSLDSPSPGDVTPHGDGESPATPTPAIPIGGNSANVDGNANSTIDPGASYATTATTTSAISSSNQFSPSSASQPSTSFTSSSTAPGGAALALAEERENGGIRGSVSSGNPPRVPPNSFAQGGAGALGLQNSDGNALELHGVDAGLVKAQDQQRLFENAGPNVDANLLILPLDAQGGYFDLRNRSGTVSSTPYSPGATQRSVGGSGEGGVSSSEDEDYAYEGWQEQAANAPMASSALSGGQSRVVAQPPTAAAPSAEQVLGDPNKVILAGYLMKQGKRKNWRKRWFVLMSTRLMYSKSHMDAKIHQQIPLTQILDAIEYVPPKPGGGGGGTRRPMSGSGPLSPSLMSGPLSPVLDDGKKNYEHTFKIITPKRTYLVCAPSEEDEIKWLAALQCLVARKNTLAGTTSVGANTSSTALQTPSTSTRKGTTGHPSPYATPQITMTDASPGERALPTGDDRSTSSRGAKVAPPFVASHGRQRSVTDAARAAVTDVEKRFQALHA